MAWEDSRSRLPPANCDTKLSRYWQSHDLCVQVPGQLQRLAQPIQVGSRGALPGVVCRPEGPVDRVTYSVIIIYSDCRVWSTADHPPQTRPSWSECLPLLNVAESANCSPHGSWHSCSLSRGHAWMARKPLKWGWIVNWPVYAGKGHLWPTEWPTD